MITRSCLKTYSKELFHVNTSLLAISFKCLIALVIVAPNISVCLSCGRFVNIVRRSIEKPSSNSLSASSNT